MAERNDIGGKMTACAPKKLVTCAARCMLDRLSFARGAGPNVLALDKARPPECRSRRLAELFVAIGILAQLMIEMRHTCDGQFACLVERMQQVCERDRIAAARQGDDHSRAGRRKLVPPDGATNAIKQH